MFFEKITKQSKLIFILILFLLFIGSLTFYNIPKEQNPDVKVPLIYTSVIMRGISASDAERLILRPIEKKLKGVANVKKISSRAVNGYASVSVEFDAGFDVTEAKSRIKDKIDEVRSELPAEIEEPIIKEIDFSKFPVLYVGMYGNYSEAQMIKFGRFLKKRIEMVPNVLEVSMVGDKDDLLEIIAKPYAFERHHVSPFEVSAAVKANNKLVSGGYMNFNLSSSVLDSDSSLPKTNKDIEELPIIARKNDVVKVGDLGVIKQTYVDSPNAAFMNGKSAIVLEVSKRYGSNIIETIETVKEIIAKEIEGGAIPSDISIEYSRDSSKKIEESLSDLGNNVIFAVILVALVVISQIGKKQGLIVATSVPISFFIGILAIDFLGYTLNMVVLFALILASGMIVDASVIVAEYADRLMSKGEKHDVAYPKASGRMAVPVLSATVGIIIVYLPLLFWPGIIGQFMKFIPITIVAVLTASILSALIFVPVLGYMFGSLTKEDEARHKKDEEFVEKSEHGDVLALTGLTGSYINLLNSVLNFPKKFIFIIIMAFFGSVFVYKTIGKGVQFFPIVDANNIQVVLHSGGNVNIDQKISMMKQIEEKLAPLSSEIKILYTKVFGNSGNQAGNYADDVAGVIDIELTDWNKRRSSDKISEDIMKNLENYSGGMLEVLQERPGPRSGEKSIQVEIMSEYQDKLNGVFDKIYDFMDKDKEIKDLGSSLPSDKFKIDIDFKKSVAMRYGVDANTLSGFLQMCTNGLIITQFRPDYADDSVDVVLKFPPKYCTIDALSEMPLYVGKNIVRLGSVANVSLKKDLSIIKKIDGNISIVISSNVQSGINVPSKVAQIDSWIKTQNFDKDVIIRFAGEEGDKKETGAFLMKAFGTAIFLKIAILIGQFGYIYYALIVMSAVILSIMGVLLGLVATGDSFGIVMCGLGVISLAGIVVSNNIILIDTYQVFMKQGLDIRSAILRTCAQRLRPILMTSATTIMGLIPMIFNFSVDFFDMKIVYNSPGGQWWEQLSTTIGGGLLVATIFTLFLTPCCLILHTPEIHGKEKKKSLLEKIKNAG
ncbi:efflux RND transporter permease subunit [Candidatus Deianiraea vastatrix]|uniref:Mdt-like/AcrB resistance protein n=1 Tax=Candidatus Deianiraea vastatrix TaxID=2163644 RepID=A0A5B8XGW8_9RICK|nr:efflux RND transporter permease subunit [Candidatus Deianiraea vastatrix]QED23401.1 Mdt-like/AcrB resistance protein [Candidatus Deianiraea vastatrix]